jgi:hypothetical protein
MSLLDHFHPPLYPTRRWESFHSFWATEIAAHLNQTILPTPYYAEAEIHVGSRVEVDVATLEVPPERPTLGNGPAVVTTATEAWAPPVPALLMPAIFPDEIEVQVFGSATGAHLVAALELVSPGNKDRAETRRAFAAKCSSYLQLGIGLVIIDVITDRLANLPNELIRLMELPEGFQLPGEMALYAVAYRPVRRATGDQIDCWPSPLMVGKALPVVPLALRGGPTLPLDLETTYVEACRRSRLSASQ